MEVAVSSVKSEAGHEAREGKGVPAVHLQEQGLLPHEEAERNEISRNVAWFLERPERWRELARYVNHTNGAISLRVIEWFCVNYCKINLFLVTGPDGRPSFVHESYQKHLVMYDKVRFDPFARTGDPTKPSNYVEFTAVDPDDGKEVTIRSNRRQLNFFRWLVEYGILRIIEKEQASVEADMKATAAHSKVRRTAGKRRQHKRLESHSFQIIRKKPQQ